MTVKDALPKSLSRLILISKWEYRQLRPTPTPRDYLYGFLVLVVLGLGVAAGASSGVSVSEGIYTVGVPQDSPYRDAIAGHEEFTVTKPDQEAFRAGQQGLLIRDGTVYVSDTARGQAAAAELRSIVKSYNDEQMKSEKNQKAAFPVKITLRYVDPATGEVKPQTDDSSSSQSDSGIALPSANPETLLEHIQLWAFRYLGIIVIPLYKVFLFMKDAIMGSVPTGVTPTGVSSPFPYRSLMLALVFFAPLNFIAQSFGSTFLEERLNRRGELLLASPPSSTEIVAGKTIPYLAAMTLAAVLISIATNAGWIGAAAILPFIIAFLGAVFVAAMLARSFKELTFVTVAVSVTLISFGFVPAMFTNIHPIALISPLTIVVEAMQGEVVTVSEFLFATTPLTLVGFVLFGFGIGLYREEDMFAQKPLRAKALDAVAAWATSLRRIPLVVAALLPLVFTAELMALPLAIPFPPKAATVLLMAYVAIVEEIAKTIPVYAAVTHNRIDSTPKTVALAGVLSGVAFFVAEKFTAIVQMVGLQRISVAEPVFQSNLGQSSATVSSPLMAVALLSAPLILHIVTATVGSFGSIRGKRGYLIGFAAAIVIHGIYDVMAVMMYA